MFATTAYALSNTEVVGQAVDPQATHSETGTPHEAEHGAFPPFDSSTYPSQILWLVITFGVFYLLISKIIAPRISATLETRESRISADLAEANRAKSEADAVVTRYEQELAAARGKAGAIASEAREAAKVKADAERKALETDLSAKITAAEQTIAAVKSKALADVGQVAEETAVEIVRALTGVAVSPSDAAATVNAIKG